MARQCRTRWPSNAAAAVLHARAPPCHAHAADVSVKWRCANRLARPRIKHQASRSPVNTEPAAVRHRCRHGELPASCVPDGVQAPLALPVAPTKTPRSLVGQTGPPVRRSGASSGRRRRSPPWPPSSTSSAMGEHSNQAYATPRPSPAASPAKATGEVVGIRPAAPPPLPWTTLLALIYFQGCNREPGAKL
jgi:hypothetical protein